MSKAEECRASSLTYETSSDSRAARENVASAHQLCSGSSAKTLTFSDKHVSQSLLLEHLDVHRRSVSDLVIDVLEASSQQHVDALHHRGVLDTDTKLGEGGDGSGSDDRVLEDDSVVDVADEFGRVARLRSFNAEQMQNSN